MSLRSGWIVLGLVAASAPAAPRELPGSDRDALVEVQERSRQALLGADAAGAAALFEEGAVLMPPGAPTVVGREAIRGFWEAGPPVHVFEIEVLEIGGDGDVAYVRGTYRMAFAGAPGEAAEQRGEFLQVLRRQSDGRWLIRADMFSSDAPGR